MKIGFYWRSIMRWCLLGTVVMFVWLMIPVAKCSLDVFRDTPLPEAQPHEIAPPTPDPEAEPEEPGFFTKLGRGASACYARTPLFGQESWKGHLLVVFAALTVLAWTLHHLEQRRKRTFDR